MHHIQQKILSALRYQPSSTYAQLRPGGVESNHFAYHLEQLIKNGYITKHNRSYVLTATGLSYVDRASHQTMTVRTQPHIVTTVVVTNDARQTLTFRHAFQPYLDLIGYPQGRLHFEEDIAQASIRELQEKSGLTGVPLAHRGIVYITAVKNGEVVSKVLSHVFSGSIVGTPDVASGDERKGTAAWLDISKTPLVEWMPGHTEIQELLADHKAGNLFFAEITADLS